MFAIHMCPSGKLEGIVLFWYKDDIWWRMRSALWDIRETTIKMLTKYWSYYLLQKMQTKYWSYCLLPRGSRHIRLDFDPVRNRPQGFCLNQVTQCWSSTTLLIRLIIVPSFTQRAIAESKSKSPEENARRIPVTMATPSITHRRGSVASDVSSSSRSSVGSAGVTTRSSSSHQMALRHRPSRSAAHKVKKKAKRVSSQHINLFMLNLGKNGVFLHFKLCHV